MADPTTDNVVDVSESRIADEWANHMAEAEKFDAPAVNDEPEKPLVSVGADGFEFPDLESGALCCMAGDWWADRYAPNWKAHGLTDDQIRKIAKPAGAVLDKYCAKWGIDLSHLAGAYAPEIALVWAVIEIKDEFREVPRYTEEQAEKRKGKKGWFSGWLSGGKKDAA